MSHRRRRRIVLGRYELYVVESEAQHIDRFLYEVGVLVSGVTELDRRNTHEENASAGVTVARRFQPRVIRVPVDFLFQRVENSCPRIRGESCARN